MCEANDGDTAMMLGRVLLENAMLIAWLLKGDGRVRLETYALFAAVLHERFSDNFAHFYSDRDEVRDWAKSRSDPFARAVWHQVFGGKHDTWAYFPDPDKPNKLRKTTIKSMFSEADADSGPASRYTGFIYDVAYARGSQFIHSGPLSVDSVIPSVRSHRHFFLSTMPSPMHRLEALHVSNVAMVFVLDSLNDYIGLGLSDRIKAISELMTQQPEEDQT
jgi:hypothetical protein